jgi:hypothetical protein
LFFDFSDGLFLGGSCRAAVQTDVLNCQRITQIVEKLKKFLDAGTLTRVSDKEPDHSCYIRKNGCGRCYVVYRIQNYPAALQRLIRPKCRENRKTGSLLEL